MIMHNEQTLIPAVLVVKPLSTAKSDLEILCKNVSQLTTLAVPKNIVIEEIIVTFGNTKDITKRIKSVLEHMDLKVLLLYSAKQVAETEKEFADFVADMFAWYGLKVMCYR